MDGRVKARLFVQCLIYLLRSRVVLDQLIQSEQYYLDNLQSTIHTYYQGIFQLFIKPVSLPTLQPASRRSSRPYSKRDSCIVSLGMSGLFKRVSETSETSEVIETPSSPETPVQFDMQILDEVFKGVTDLVRFSEALLSSLRVPEITVDHVIDGFTSLQSQFTLFSAYFTHLKEAFAALQQLKQHDRINTYLKVHSPLCNDQTVLTSPSSHQQPLECCLFLPVEVGVVLFV